MNVTVSNNYSDVGSVPGRNSPAKITSLAASIFVAIGGNSAVIYKVIQDRRLHRAPFYFLISLCVADTSRGAFCLPFVLSTALNASRWPYSESLCKLVAFLDTFFVFVSFFSLFTVAVDRHISILHSKYHNKKSNRLTCLILILINWFLSFIIALPPIFHLGTYKFIPLNDQCTFEHRYYKHNDTLGFVFIQCGLLLAISIVYNRIFVFLRHHRKLNPIFGHPARSREWTFALPNRLPGMTTNTWLHGLSAAANAEIVSESQLRDDRQVQSRVQQRPHPVTEETIVVNRSDIFHANERINRDNEHSLHKSIINLQSSPSDAHQSDENVDNSKNNLEPCRCNLLSNKTDLVLSEQDINFGDANRNNRGILRDNDSDDITPIQEEHSTQFLGFLETPDDQGPTQCRPLGRDVVCLDKRSPRLAKRWPTTAIETTASEADEPTSNVKHRNWCFSTTSSPVSNRLNHNARAQSQDDRVHNDLESLEIESQQTSQNNVYQLDDYGPLEPLDSTREATFKRQRNQAYRRSHCEHRLADETDFQRRYIRIQERIYSRKRRMGNRDRLVLDKNEHLTRLFFIITIMFVVSWLPYLFVACWQTFDENNNVPNVLVIISAWMTYFQVAFDPLVYIVITKPFKSSKVIHQQSVIMN